ncbi:MAG: hypothetical protein GX575_20580 [Candidatus Anammoximicrobium sp.]|nr:hypothetical protein [Candidatus Anammoximicrobium sp.]
MPVEQLTFTVVEGGCGFNPEAATGYQIKACSPGLVKDAEARERVANICTHYGQAVYDRISSVVSQAINEENDWCRRQQEPPETLPPEVLKHFPVVWSYDRIRDDLFALIRTCYLGFCPDRKPGNFFAHALVFHPDDLFAFDYNPIVLSRSGCFWSNHVNDATELQSLEDLGTAKSASAPINMLRQSPYREHLEAILSALTTASPSERPVVFCLRDWGQVPQIVEELLALLPPATRCRTTFCTYENDRSWVPSVRGQRPEKAVAAHQLLALCGAEDRSWNFYADDYRSKFALFNFVGSRFSELPPPRPFARYAANCVQRERTRELGAYHQLIEQLDAGRAPEAWDALIPAATILKFETPREDFASGVSAVCAVSNQPQQSEAAIRVLLPWFAELADGDRLQDISLLSSHVATLAERAGTGSCQVPAFSE